MSKALDKARELAKKTNAAVMVVNETTDEAYVVMTIDEYEKLLGYSPKVSNFQPSTPNYQPPSASNKQEAKTREDMSEVGGGQLEVGGKSLAALTEEELLAKMSEQIREWRSAQVDREQIVLAEMPAEIKFKNERGETSGAYNLKSSVDFKVDNREEEERFFLDDLD
jgi:hypothetical protein